MSAFDPKRTWTQVQLDRLSGAVENGPLVLGDKRVWEEVMFRFRTPLVAAALVAGLQITAAAEREIPKFDITAACRGSGSVQTPEKCMQDEQAARDQLAKLWPQFEQSDASRCIQITTSPAAAASYVELLTCLQAAKIEDKAKDPLGPLPTIAK